MRAVVQRVLEASVSVDGEVVGTVKGPGLLVLLGVTHDDSPAQVGWMARKIWDVRLLRGERSASDIDAPVLVVSQFTLYGRRAQRDARPGTKQHPGQCRSRSTRRCVPSSSGSAPLLPAAGSGRTCRSAWSTTVP